MTDDDTQQNPSWSGRAFEWAEELPRAETSDLAHVLPRVIADRYRLESIIAEGGMSLVYQATQIQLGRRVAVKVMRPDSNQRRSEYLDRFVTEAATLAQVTHPNVVTIHDYGQTDDDDAFIAMEYLQGRLLSDLIGTATPMFVPQAVHIGIQIARAMRAAHQEGALHRDLKPSNVMLVQGADDDDFNHVKVIDFGLARLGEQGAFQGKGLYGSPRYMAPEQIAGESIDPRSDIYALGVMIFAMISGRTPFDGDNPRDILAAHLQDPVPAMASLGYRRAGTVELDHFVRRCLEKRPEARYQSMAEVVRELKRVYSNLPAQSADLVDAQGVPMHASHYSVRSTTDIDMTPAGTYERPAGIYDNAPQPIQPAGPAPQAPGRFPSAAPTSASSAPYAEPLNSGISSDVRLVTGQPVQQERQGRGLLIPVLLLLVLGAGAFIVFQLMGADKTAAPAVAETPRDVRLKLDSEPTAAQVFEEGALVGLTPMVRTYPESVRGTERTFIFKREGYASVERTLQLNEPQESLHVSLARQAPSVADQADDSNVRDQQRTQRTQRTQRSTSRRRVSRRAPDRPTAQPTARQAPASAARPASTPKAAPIEEADRRDSVDLLEDKKKGVPILDDSNVETTPQLDDETPLLD